MVVLEGQLRAWPWLAVQNNFRGRSLGWDEGQAVVKKGHCLPASS